MFLRTPHYYKDFTCIADKCVDNCCFGGWQIDIDSETIEKYNQLSGDFGSRLRASIDTENNCFRLHDGQCPFLLKSNLCEIYKELGADYMGVVCAQFPRFSEYFGNVKETGLGLACEEAARIILFDDKPFTLNNVKIDEEEVAGEYDEMLGAALFKLRDKLMELTDVKDLQMPVSMILCVILDSFESIQNMINKNDYRAVEEFCETFKAEIPNVPEMNINPHDICKSVWYSYLDLEPINSYWEELSDTVFSALYENNVDYFSNINDKTLSRMYSRMIQYYLYRYMMKASFDHDLVGKAKLIIANVIVICDIFYYVNSLQAEADTNLSDNLAKHFCKKEAGEWKSAFLEIIHIFSRQIEYSDDNILELYDSFIFDEAYSYEVLHSLLTMMGH